MLVVNYQTVTVSSGDEKKSPWHPPPKKTMTLSFAFYFFCNVTVVSNADFRNPEMMLFVIGHMNGLSMSGLYVNNGKYPAGQKI